MPQISAVAGRGSQRKAMAGEVDFGGGSSQSRSHVLGRRCRQVAVTSQRAVAISTVACMAESALVASQISLQQTIPSEAWRVLYMLSNGKLSCTWAVSGS